ncbi:hypothetical protein FRB95_014659 [Tulasnella sp. JGI-2019a]|nr:hypothetical protein FRB95_014659 [Tulasnella sp. JGI-2019a]
MSSQLPRGPGRDATDTDASSSGAQCTPNSQHGQPPYLVPSVTRSDRTQAQTQQYPIGIPPGQAWYPPAQAPGAPRLHYEPPPQMATQNSFPYPHPPNSTPAMNNPYSAVQAMPRTWPPPQPNDPRLTSQYQVANPGQSSSVQAAYYIPQETPPSSSSSSEWPGSQSGSEQAPAGPTVDDNRRGLAALADAPDNNTGHPGYAIKVLAEFAIKGSPTGRMSLNEIYLAVEARYPIFKTEAAANWRNSARHDISYDPRFINVPRGAGDNPGKGGLWMFDPNVPTKPAKPRPKSVKSSNNTEPASSSGAQGRSRSNKGTVANDE